MNNQVTVSRLFDEPPWSHGAVESGSPVPVARLDRFGANHTPGDALSRPNTLCSSSQISSQH